MRCLWIDVEGLREFTNNFSRDSLCFGRGSNRTYPDYKSQALPRHQLPWSAISYGPRTVKHGSDQGSQVLYSISPDCDARAVHEAACVVVVLGGTCRPLSLE